MSSHSFRPPDATISVEPESTHHGEPSNEDEVENNAPEANTPEQTPNSDASAMDVPAKKLTVFALRLTVLEKAANNLGTLGFIWATVVLLAGFALLLEQRDFWYITVILVMEGARVFSRTSELEWQHQSTWNIRFGDLRRSSFRMLQSGSEFIIHWLKGIFSRTPEPQPPRQAATNSQEMRALRAQRNGWLFIDVPLIPYLGRVFQLKNIGYLFAALQICSAITSITLSLIRLFEQNFGSAGQDSTNGKAALNLFYALTLAKATLFLIEMAYWTMNMRKLLLTVSQQCGLGRAGIPVIRRFFYEAYSKSISGSIFDGLKMDLMIHAEELINSGSPEEQPMGIIILRSFAKNPQLGTDTLQKIGSSMSTTERILDMLTWKNPRDQDIRKGAAELVAMLASKKQNALRVAMIPGAMESVLSLLHTETISIEAANLQAGDPNYDFSVFNQYGLQILKNMFRDPDNRERTTSVRGLLPKIISLTVISPNMLLNRLATESQIKTVRRALKVVKFLASTKGSNGVMLRQAISENVFIISHLRDILQFGVHYMELQQLAINIISSLSLEKTSKEMIGNTGGIIKKLLAIFLEPGESEMKPVRDAAGDALTALLLGSSSNCNLALRMENMLEQLIRALGEPPIQINTTKILRSLCAYSGSESADRLRMVTNAIPIVSPSLLIHPIIVD